MKTTAIPFARPLLAACAAMSCAAAAAAPQELLRQDTRNGPIRVVELAAGLEHPWGLAFLPDGRMLVTERAGRLRIIDRDGNKGEPMQGLPEVRARGQGGLLDVALSPDFANDRNVYFSYAEPGDKGARTAVAFGRMIDDQKIANVRVIFRQHPPHEDSDNHFGSRLVFSRDGQHLFITTGDRWHLAERAQDLSSHIGKILRVTRDGDVPQDNPFVGRPGALPEIWSIGHRHIQGAALHPRTGQLWVSEHGARGGDELNVIERGRNYGWPIIGYGEHYSGGHIGWGTHYPGMEQPLVQWTPAVAPSGLEFYRDGPIAAWKDNVLYGSLLRRQLIRLQFDGNRMVDEEHLLGDLKQRIRAVRQGPDGHLYLLTDHEDGKLLRLEPAQD